MPLLELPTEIHIQVLSTLSLADMRVMMLVSAGWHYLIKTFLARKLHIGLLPYVNDPPAFRDTMRRTHSVISGSFALDFALHGTTRPPFAVSDLDVYCGVANAITVIEYLRRKESYLAVPLAFFPCVQWIDDYDGGIATVVRMLHPRGSKIDIICSSRISALHPLSYFWSTAVMSFLTADGFCSAYHSLTERGISCINPSREVTPRVKRCIKKYETRGFIIDDFGGNQVRVDSNAKEKFLTDTAPRLLRTPLMFLTRTMPVQRHRRT